MEVREILEQDDNNLILERRKLWNIILEKRHQNSALG